MHTKVINLIPGSRNIQVDKAQSNETETTLTYTCPAWPGKTCKHKVPGKWEIKKQNANIVTLANYDQIISDIKK